MFLQLLHVIVTGVLATLIGMVHQPGARPALLERPRECQQRKLGIQTASEGPADHFTRENIQHDRQIDKISLESDVSNIGYPPRFHRPPPLASLTRR